MLEEVEQKELFVNLDLMIDLSWMVLDFLGESSSCGERSFGMLKL